MRNSQGRFRERPSIPWRLFGSELIGTALLVLCGLSLVIGMFGTGTPMAQIVPSEGLRRLITGFLFGATGAIIALSPIGKQSGAHINPAVTFGFWVIGKLAAQNAIGYILAQLLGAVIGCLPLLAWGKLGKSVAFGATLPGQGYSTALVFLGEVLTTFAMVSLLAIFLGIKKIRPFTPMIFPFLYAVMVFLEAPLSGTSTNPARSFGPSVISGQWEGWWIYWIGPLSGTFLALLACSRLGNRIEVAKLYHFEDDQRGVLRGRLYWRQERRKKK